MTMTTMMAMMMVRLMVMMLQLVTVMMLKTVAHDAGHCKFCIVVIPTRWQAQSPSFGSTKVSPRGAATFLQYRTAIKCSCASRRVSENFLIELAWECHAGPGWAEWQGGRQAAGQRDRH